MTNKPRTGSRSRRTKKSRLGWWTGAALVLLVAAYVGVLDLSRPHVEGERLRYDSFVSLIGDRRIIEATILDQDAYVVGTFRNDAGQTLPYNTPLVATGQRDMLDTLARNKVPTTVNQQVGKRVANLASFLLPGLIITLLFGYLVISYRRGTGLFNVRSGARRVRSEVGDATFADVAGQDAAVAELREIKEYLSEPERFQALGAQAPRGVLLFGPPGCGKTLLARALATEAGAAFFSISGSDFVELYAGVGAARVRDLFREARENAPAVVFIDEVDSIGRARATGPAVASAGENDQALNQVLAELDGFSTTEGVILVAATNRPDVLDPALLRPGRFDRTIGLERPDEAARAAILAVHARTKQLDDGIDLADLARRAIGLTGADLANVMNEAALLAARAHKASVGQADVDLALQRVLEAPERQRRLAMRDRSVGKRFTNQERIGFADVAGVDDALVELAEVRDYLAEPERFAAMGARVPRGILLSGPPGCGKTLLARAVAGEANAAFVSVAASEFVEVFVGEGASRVRDLFAEARAIAPAIVFIDEIDAIGARRGVTTDGNREREQTLNQILVELDGFEARAGVMVMAATNRPDTLDPALVRPGRFDRHVTVALPQRDGRRAILALHARNKPLAPDVDLAAVAGLTRGFSGADLANVLNEAALLATRRGQAQIVMATVEEGVERAALGISSARTLLSDEERRIVAYHEAGHALVALAVPGATPPHRLSIVPRPGAFGYCSMADTKDRVLRSRSYLRTEMAVLLGGRAAEELVFGDPVSAAGSDLQRAGDIARAMVCELGMSDTAGPLVFGGLVPGGALSASDAELASSEIRRLVDEAHERATKVLAGARPVLDAVVSALLEKETLTAADLAELVRNESAIASPDVLW